MYAIDKNTYITTPDLEMLRRVLDTAGFPVGPEQAGHDKRDGAARVLITLFEQGMTVESKLIEALRGTMAASTAAMSTGLDIGHDGFGSPSKSTVSAAGGYRYGRRVERNGTWTIYHVFSGVPAEYGTWKMVGLNVKTADRALRILNAPARKGAAS
jgi:hypothetical protein